MRDRGCCVDGDDRRAADRRAVQLGVVTQSIGTARSSRSHIDDRSRAAARSSARSCPYGRVWTPSADSAARITLSDAIEINGVEARRRQLQHVGDPDSASWTLIFNSVPSVFHLRYPDGRDVLRVHADAGARRSRRDADVRVSHGRRRLGAPRDPVGNDGRTALSQNRTIIL